MQFRLTIDTDNAAFDEDAASEIGRILRKAADELTAGPHGHTRSILDLNGNRVGSWKWWHEDEM